MVFSQLFGRLRAQKDEKGAQKRKSSKRGGSSDKKRLEQAFLDNNTSPSSKKDLNKALNKVDNAIKQEGATNQLLLQKANILLRKSKFRQARHILDRISKDKKDKATAEEAKKLLAASQELQQQEATNKKDQLIKSLHKTAARYERTISSFAEQDNETKDADFTQLVRREASRARTAELPKLSYELIEQALEAGHESPWLLHDQALSLHMMGQQGKALELLRELKATSKGEKITNSIRKNIQDINKNAPQNQFTSKRCLAKQSLVVAKRNTLQADFLPGINQITKETNIKALVFKKIRSILNEKPKASLELVDTILDFYPEDLAALQLKGEVLNALQRSDEAIEIWRQLMPSQNRKISKKSAELIETSITSKAELINKSKSPKTAIQFYIRQHLKHNLHPRLNKAITRMVRQVEPTNRTKVEPELREHQLLLQYNTLVIECLEAQAKAHNRSLGSVETAQDVKTLAKRG